MTCEPITPADFKTAKPQFSNVDDPVVQSYIDLGRLFVDGSWPDTACNPAQIAIVCHLMTLDGLGTDAESVSNAAGTAEYQSVKSGSLTLTRFRQESSGDYSQWINSTKCGRFFAVLLRTTKSGPRVASISAGCGASPYAKDVYRDGPLVGWPGCFW